MLKAVLFDVDDTLIDWRRFSGDWRTIETPHLHKFYTYLVQQGYTLPALETFIDDYLHRVEAAWAAALNSLRAPHVGRILVDSAIAAGVPDSAITMRECMDAYAWDAVNETDVFPDAPDVLRELRQRGLKLGTITNSFYPAALRDREFAALGLLDYFPDCRISAADVGYLKPHNAIFREALTRLGVHAEEAVFVGDNPTADIVGAQRVGMRAIIRKHDPPRHKLYNRVTPDGEIARLGDLPDLLDQLYAEV
jgi:putative hydrolase of the HAD superfamily